MAKELPEGGSFWKISLRDLQRFAQSFENCILLIPAIGQWYKKYSTSEIAE